MRRLTTTFHRWGISRLTDVIHHWPEAEIAHHTASELSGLLTSKTPALRGCTRETVCHDEPLKLRVDATVLALLLKSPPARV